MPKKKLSRLSRFFLSAVCLAGAYLLCRFGLFSLHGMKQWPAVLAAAGFAALVAAALYDFWIASSTTIIRPDVFLAFGWAKPKPIPAVDKPTVAGLSGQLFLH